MGMLATLVQGVDDTKSPAFVDICLDALKDPKLEVRDRSCSIVVVLIRFEMNVRCYRPVTW